MYSWKFTWISRNMLGSPNACRWYYLKHGVIANIAKKTTTKAPILSNCFLKLELKLPIPLELLPQTRTQTPIQCASSQLCPVPTSTSMGTCIGMAPSIFSLFSLLRTSTSSCTASKTNSSCTCKIICERMLRAFISR